MEKDEVEKVAIICRFVGKPKLGFKCGRKYQVLLRELKFLCIRLFWVDVQHSKKKYGKEKLFYWSKNSLKKDWKV